MKTYVSWTIHAVFGCVYLGLLCSHLAGWPETRNAVIVTGLGLCGFGLVTCGVLRSLPGLCQPTGRETWNALTLLGLGLCFLVLATCGARWIVDDRKAGSRVPSPEWVRQQALEPQRQADLQMLFKRRPAAEMEAARQRSAILKDYLAGQAQSLIDSVRSGLDGSKIDRLQRKKNDLEAELESFNPYASAAAVERAEKLAAELARVQAEQEKAIESLQRQAEDLVLAAVERGDLGAFRQIQDQILQRPRAFSEAQHLAFEQASPEWLAQEREFERQIEQRQELVTRRDEPKKSASEANDRLTEAMSDPIDNQTPDREKRCRRPVFPRPADQATSVQVPGVN